MANLRIFFQIIRECSSFLIVITIPMVLLPLVLLLDENGEFDQKTRCAYVILLVALYYTFEAIPMPVAALLPVLLFPLFGIQDTAKVTIDYMRPVVMMLLGSLIMAATVEYCSLHKRIAIKILLSIGSSKRRLLFGIMFTTMLFSMWLSNVSTTSFMVPIALAIVDGLIDNSEENLKKIGNEDELTKSLSQNDNVNEDTYKSVILKAAYQNEELKKDDIETSSTDSISLLSLKSNKKSKLILTRLFLLGVAYSSSIGGSGTILGTATNYYLIEYLKLDEQSGGGNGATALNFGTWMLMNVPVMLINTFIVWIYLTIMYIGIPHSLYFWRTQKKKKSEESKRNKSNVINMLQKSHDKMGEISFQEIMVALIFASVIILCFFRKPGFLPGWSDLIENIIISDATVFVLGVALLFIIPRKLSYFRGKSCGTLADWKYVQSKIPWGILLINGAGFSMSTSAKQTGLSDWIGEVFKGIGVLPKQAILLITLVITTMGTEFVSNTAVANIMLPILISISEKLAIHPLYLTLPAAVTCSFGFMLPAATYSNMIIFGTGYIRTFDMIKTGVFINIICVMTLFVLQISWGNIIFNFNEYNLSSPTSEPLLLTFKLNHT